MGRARIVGPTRSQPPVLAARRFQCRMTAEPWMRTLRPTPAPRHSMLAGSLLVRWHRPSKRAAHLLGAHRAGGCCQMSYRYRVLGCPGHGHCRLVVACLRRLLRERLSTPRTKAQASRSKRLGSFGPLSGHLGSPPAACRRTRAWARAAPVPASAARRGLTSVSAGPGCRRWAPEALGVPSGRRPRAAVARARAGSVAWAWSVSVEITHEGARVARLGALAPRRRRLGGSRRLTLREFRLLFGRA